MSFEFTSKTANAHIAQYFSVVKTEVLFSSNCFTEWMEVWKKNDSQKVTAEDLRCFAVVPRGQGHTVIQLNESTVKLLCSCDSGD